MTKWIFVGVGATATVTSGNLTLAEPAGVLEGDLLVACIAYRSNAVFTNPASWAAAATQQSTGNTAAAATGIASGVMAYIARGSSAPALIWTRTAGDVAFGQIVAYRGGTVLDTGNAATLGANSTTVSATGVTTAEDNELLVAMVAGATTVTVSGFAAATAPTTASGATNVLELDIPAAWTERADSATLSGADTALAIADALKSAAGATGTISATASVTSRHVFMFAAFKLTGQSAADIKVPKLTGYAVLGPRDDRITSSKVTGYAVVGPREDRITVPKLTGYSVIRAIPFIPPPRGNGGGGNGGSGKNPKGKDNGLSLGFVGALQANRGRRVRKRFVIPMQVTTIYTQGISVTATATVSAIKAVAAAVTTSATSSTAVAAARVMTQVIAASVSTVVSISRSVAFAVAASASAAVAALKSMTIAAAADVSSAATTASSVGKPLAAAVSTATSLTRQTGKIIATGVAGAVSSVLAIAKGVAASVSTTTAVTAGLVFNVAIAAAVSTAVALDRSIGKVVDVAITSAVSIGLAITKAIAAAVTGTVEATKAIAISFSTTVASFLDGITALFRPQLRDHERIASVPVEIRTVDADPDHDRADPLE